MKLTCPNSRASGSTIGYRRRTKVCHARMDVP
jgi:hypothetical protein